MAYLSLPPEPALTQNSIYNIELYKNILYFAWEDQSEKVYCIAHKVVINCITVLYEPYSTVMRLIGHIQHCYALN